MIYAFYIFAFIAVAAAGGILFARQLFQAALLLLACLLAVAGLYAVSFAEWVAVTQILVYAGGVVVIIIFGIMLTARIPGRPTAMSNNKWFAGALLGIAIMGFLITLFMREDFGQTMTPLTDARFTMVNRFGMALMTDYLLPFEVAGLLLLVTLVGAAIIAATRNNNSIS
jgi:NADH-quinone oxidoreductase subunit J